MIPPNAIDNRAARGSKEDDPDSEPHGLSVLVKHKPLLVLGLALALFHLGNAAIVPLYALAAVSQQVNGPSFVATTIVVAQGVMVIASIVAMRAAEAKNYWPVLLASFMALPFTYWSSIPSNEINGRGATSAMSQC